MSRPLSSNQFGVIAAIQQSPHYRFVGAERELAKRMVESGILRWESETDGTCSVTHEGWKRYAQELNR